MPSLESSTQSRTDKAQASSVPSDDALDSTLAFLREGYRFVSNRCNRLGTDLFKTRIMLTPVVCMRGREAAEVFYTADRFTRVGAMPKSGLRLLQDEGSVQMLDGRAHRQRKLMFMRMMTPERIEKLSTLFAGEWRAAMTGWQQRGSIVLHDEVGEVLTRAVATWAGAPLAETDAKLRTRQLMAMIENAGGIGPSHWWARFLRVRCERWAKGAVRQARAGEVTAPDSPLNIIAQHRSEDGTLLDEDAAAVELLNVLRPTVAVGRFIVFAAHALHENPQWAEHFAAGDEEDLEGFVQEVRRYYPFFPVIGGRVRHPFIWRGHAFKTNDWVLLDLYGTDHDQGVWRQPHEFRPERFRAWQGDPNSLIPQGGGPYDTGHRCPGEGITIALMTQAVRMLTLEMSYSVPPQDLAIRLDRMPALPNGGFVVANIRQIAGR